MTRRAARTTAAVLAAFALVVLGAGPAAAVGARLGEPAASDRSAAAPAPVAAVPAGVDDFTFASFDAVYELDRDEAERSVLTTTETLVAVFPEFDQNRGIRRAIPMDYQGHPTDIHVESVTDATGAPRGFEVEADEAGEFLLVTVRADDFVHGEQTYVIRYTQHNVTLEPDDAAIDEFYWDVNGTGWAQPFGRVRAEVRMSADVAAGFTGATACYRGWSGSGTPCESLTTTDAAPPVVVAEAFTLGPYENLTVAVGFDPGTFEPRDDSFWASPAAIAGGLAAVFAGLAMIAAIVLRVLRWRDHPGRGTIIAQYEPPAGISAMEAADLVGHPDKGVTATILERAVAGELRVIETGRKKFAVEFIGGELGDRDAQSIVMALYSGNPVPGARRDLKTRDITLGRRLLSLRQSATKRVVQRNLRRRPDPVARVLLAIGAIGAATLSLMFGIFALDDQRGGALAVPAVQRRDRRRHRHVAGRRERAAAHRARPRGPRPPRGAPALHPPGRGRSPAGAAEPERCDARRPARRGIRRRSRGRDAGCADRHHVARPGRGAQAQRAPPAVRRALRPRARVGPRAGRAVRGAGRDPGLVLRARRLQRRVVLGRRVVVLVGLEHVVVGVELELVLERVRRRRVVGRRRRRRRRRRRLIRRGARCAGRRARRARQRVGAARGSVDPRRSSSVRVVGDALVAQVHASLGVDAVDVVGEIVVERPVVVVGRELVLVELGVLRDREFVVIGHDGARPREIVHG